MLRALLLFLLVAAADGERRERSCLELAALDPALLLEVLQVVQQQRRPVVVVVVVVAAVVGTRRLVLRSAAPAVDREMHDWLARRFTTCSIEPLQKCHSS
jgi:hypothetical protein